VAERLRRAVEEAEINTRILVTEELQQRFNQEVAKIQSDLQNASKGDYDRALAEANEGAAICSRTSNRENRRSCPQRERGQVGSRTRASDGAA
jgi:hypothetical protein